MAITLLHMKKKSFFFVFLMISFAFLLIIQQQTTSASTTSSSSSSAQALLKWKQSLINSTAISDSWSDVTNPCNWTGIYCDDYFNIIEGIDLLQQSLNDTLDEFDFSAFPNLTFLYLDSNSLFGEIPNQIGSLSKLTSLYLNNNYFTGLLPAKYFQSWKAMMMVVGNEPGLKYIVDDNSYYHISVTLSYKGQERVLEKILTTFATLDLSDNRFEGEIPEVIGDLKSLILLNLSRNDLIDHIPSSLGNLKNLESLDLSQNKLSGEIPQQLLFLNFLAVLNVTQNHLEGSIPRGKQFDTFSSDSYEGNPRLCGFPLSRKCIGVNVMPPPTMIQELKNSRIFDWKIFMLIGYGCGVVIGVAIGYTIFWKENGWLTRTFEEAICRQGKRLMRIHRLHANGR